MATSDSSFLVTESTDQPPASSSQWGLGFRTTNGENWSAGYYVAVSRANGYQFEYLDANGNPYWAIQVQPVNGRVLIGDPGNGAGVRQNYVNTDVLRVLGNINAVGGTVNTDTGFGLSGNTFLTPSSLNASSQIKGRIVQFVQATTTTCFNTSSTSFQTTNLSATITPTCDSNYIKITVGGTIMMQSASDRMFATIARGSANLGSSLGLISTNKECSGAMCVYDHPNTMAATTYNVQIRSDSSAANAYGFSANGEMGYIILEELAQ